MFTNTRRIEYTGKGTQIDIQPLSDIHIGARGHAKEKFLEVIERIRTDPNRYTIVMGDIFDATLWDHKFFDPESMSRDFELDDIIEQWYQYAVDSLRPIKDKILGIHCGNHDERIRLKYHNNLVKRLAAELGAPYLGYMAFTKLVFYRKFASGKSHNDGIYTIASSPTGTEPFHEVGEESFKPQDISEVKNEEEKVEEDSYMLYTWHGGYSGRRVGGNLNAVEDLARDHSADIYLTGHTHQIVIDKKEKMAMGKTGHLERVVKLFAVCGNFLEAYGEDYTTYSELKGLPPTRVGTVTISIYPFQRRIQAHE